MSDTKCGTHADLRRRRLVGTMLGAPLLATSLLRATSAVAAAPAVPVVGAPLRVPDATLFDGSAFTAAEAEGNVLVVYWWASWCPFCAVQTPDIQKLWEENRGKGLTVLGISVDSRIEPARRYMAQHRYTFPTTFNTPALEQVLRKPGKALPVICVRGRTGRVEMLEPGQIFPEDVQQITRFL